MTPVRLTRAPLTVRTWSGSNAGDRGDRAGADLAPGRQWQKRRDRRSELEWIEALDSGDAPTERSAPAVSIRSSSPLPPFTTSPSARHRHLLEGEQFVAAAARQAVGPASTPEKMSFWLEPTIVSLPAVPIRGLIASSPAVQAVKATPVRSMAESDHEMTVHAGAAGHRVDEPGGGAEVVSHESCLAGGGEDHLLDAGQNAAAETFNWNPWPILMPKRVRRAGAAVDGFGARELGARIVDEGVVAIAADKRVGTEAAGDGVIAVAAVDGVDLLGTDDRVVAGGAVQKDRILAGRPRGRKRCPTDRCSKSKQEDGVDACAAGYLVDEPRSGAEIVAGESAGAGSGKHNFFDTC